MTRWHLLLALAVVLLTAAGSFADDAEKKAKEQLTGTWKVVAVEANGKKFPAEATKDFRFIFTADTLTRKRGEQAESGAGYRLNPSKSPAWIDMTGQTDGKDVVIPAVYALDGDTLQLCFRMDYKVAGKPNAKQQRPEKLSGGEGSEQVLMTLKREKP